MSSDDRPSEFFGLGRLLDFLSPAAIERTKAEYRRLLEQEMRSRADLARAIAQERQAMAGAARNPETIRRERELQALERENSEGQRIAFLNLRELDANDIHIRFVKPGDPVSDADREAYAKWCGGGKERQGSIRKNPEAMEAAPKGDESKWIN
jgi:ParB-like chromosome segregation protein Spo0J